MSISKGNVIQFVYDNELRRGTVDRVFIAKKNAKEIVVCNLGKGQYKSFRLEDMSDIKHIGLLRQFFRL